MVKTISSPSHAIADHIFAWESEQLELRLTRYHTLQSRLTYKQTSVAPRFKPPAWLFLSCLCTLMRILLLLFSVLPPSIHVLFKKKCLQSIWVNKAGGAIIMSWEQQSSILDQDLTETMMYALFAPLTHHSTPRMLHSTESFSPLF